MINCEVLIICQLLTFTFLACPALNQNVNLGTWLPARCTTYSSQLGSKCQLLCKHGYQHFGSIVIICGESGWEGIIPQCECEFFF